MKTTKDKVVLITGGSNGIGAAACKKFVSEGATVIIADMQEPASYTPSDQVHFHCLDVTSESQWISLFQKIESSFTSLDVLVNAAGIVGDVLNGSLESTTLDEWHRVLAVNLDGTFLGCREAVKLMRKQGSGAIVNLSSVGAYYPTTQSVAYGASKGAVTQLTKSVALFASMGNNTVRCNSVHPGRIETKMLDDILTQKSARARQNNTQNIPTTADRTPMGAKGTPEDVANLIYYLASDEARYITGAEFVVDGGWKLLR
ncbi:SDR family oxidoreductase [Advenella sp. FME57]|uniref:SDR family NAD(P)-dependent oxidoreductase n=1 Tax=Advenella sp. FME57 TaxID=2742604 RepID=UPI001866B668